MEVALDQARERVLTLLSEHNTADEAERIADVIFFAQLSGDSGQGVLKLLGTEPVQNVQRVADPETQAGVGPVVNVDGGAAAGMLVWQLATDEAIARAQTFGVAVVGMRNYFASSGALAYYAERIADAGLVAICMASVLGSTAYAGSLEPLLGTNPIAFGVPTATTPFLVDFSTSEATWAELVVANLTGTSIRSGAAIDSDGVPTTDPAAAMTGALLAFGGHKGAALALAVEVMAGPLVGAGYCTVDPEDEWGGMIIAFDPEKLTGPGYRERVTDALDRIRQSRAVDEGTVRIAGERSAMERDARRVSGIVDIPEEAVVALGLEALG